jgi:DivIVA domain-containing protein
MEISLTGADTRRAWHDVAVLYLQFVIVAAVFGGVAWVAAGRGGGIADPMPDRPDVALPDDRQLGKADIDATRFTVGWRGYRMDEVDRVLDRLAAEIDYRDRLIAEMTGPTAIAYGSSASYEPVPRASDRFDAPAAGAGAAGTAQTAVARPGSGSLETEGAGPQSTQPGGAAASGESGAEAASGESGGPDEPLYDDNPLSAWYRRREPPA